MNTPKATNRQIWLMNTIKKHGNISKDEKLKPQRVVLRVYHPMIDYVKTTPIHPSQKVGASRHDEFCDFTYHVCLTHELSQQILALGENVEVIEPQELIDKMRNHYIKALERYDKH